MKFTKTLLLAAVLAGLAAGSAQAFNVSHSIRSTGPYPVNSYVIVDVFLDAEPDLSLLSVSVDVD